MIGPPSSHTGETSWLDDSSMQRSHHCLSAAGTCRSSLLLYATLRFRNRPRQSRVHSPLPRHVRRLLRSATARFNDRPRAQRSAGTNTFTFTEDARDLRQRRRPLTWRRPSGPLWSGLVQWGGGLGQVGSETQRDEQRPGPVTCVPVDPWGFDRWAAKYAAINEQ